MIGVEKRSYARILPDIEVYARREEVVRGGAQRWERFEGDEYVIF
jgi:hypothetical protein